MINRSSCADCEIRKRSLCATLDERALVELTSIGQRRHIRRGEALFWAGDAATICGNVLSGALQLTASTHDGREQAVATLYPADFIGRPYAEETVFTVKALADSEICAFPREPFEQMLESHVALERRVMAEAFRKLDDARTRLLTVTRQTAAEKVAGFLLDMAGREEIKCSRATADGPVTFELPVQARPDRRRPGPHDRDGQPSAHPAQDRRHNRLAQRPRRHHPGRSRAQGLGRLIRRKLRRRCAISALADGVSRRRATIISPNNSMVISSRQVSKTLRSA